VVRIAQVSPLFESVPPKLYGGTERVVHFLTEELVRQGHDVTLFASGDSTSSATVVPICAHALRLGGACKDELAHHVRMIDEVFRRAPAFDLIHFHLDYLHFPTAERQRTPHLTTQHGRLDIPDLVPLYRTFPRVPMVSISDAQREPLDWLAWQGTVHHGLPPELLHPHPQPGRYFAFLGRMSVEKRPDRAIEIARRADMPLKMAAKVDKSDRDFFEAVVRPLLDPGFVEFVGEINEHEKDEFLGNAAALLFPIDWPEPFGLVMIEAMACGTPVVAWRCGSVPEIVDDGVSGFIVDDMDAAVAAARRAAVMDRATVRRAFDDRFTAERMARNYVQIYRRMVWSASTRRIAAS
jgi:glycosyltransferase involved in cell wall biosynthesis